MSGKRTDYLSKEQTYMAIAHIIAQRSKDPKTRVGAVIVSNEDRVVSLGYNGFPNGCSDDDFNWDREEDEDGFTKYDFVTHAEANCIYNFRGNNNIMKNGTIYVTLFPCNECAKAIIQVGIKKIIYDSDKYNGTHGNKAAKKMLDAAGVEYVKFSDINTKDPVVLIIHDEGKTNDNEEKEV